MAKNPDKHEQKFVCGVCGRFDPELKPAVAVCQKCTKDNKKREVRMKFVDWPFSKYSYGDYATKRNEFEVAAVALAASALGIPFLIIHNAAHATQLEVKTEVPAERIRLQRRIMRAARRVPPFVVRWYLNKVLYASLGYQNEHDSRFFQTLATSSESLEERN